MYIYEIVVIGRRNMRPEINSTIENGYEQTKLCNEV